MQRRAIFQNKLLPYVLLAPQIVITAVFFFWPAGQAIYQSFLLQDAFGLRQTFVGFENFRTLLADPLYLDSAGRTVVFSASVTALSMTSALLLAVLADRHIRGATAYKTLLVWPYAVAPAVAAVRWLLSFHLPSFHRPVRSAAPADWHAPGLQAQRRPSAVPCDPGPGLETGQLQLSLL